MRGSLVVVVVVAAAVKLAVEWVSLVGERSVDAVVFMSGPGDAGRVVWMAGMEGSFVLSVGVGGADGKSSVSRSRGPLVLRRGSGTVLVVSACVIVMLIFSSCRTTGTSLLRLASLVFLEWPRECVGCGVAISSLCCVVVGFVVGFVVVLWLFSRTRMAL